MTNKRFDLYQVVTDRIIAALEAGTIPWKKPWTTRGHLGLPYNGASGRPYAGLNVLLLWATAADLGYADPRWYTFRQAITLGANLKGEKSTMVTLWKPWTRTVQTDSGAEEEETRWVFRYYRVFNAEQCGFEPLEERAPVDPKPGFEAAAEVLERSSARVEHGGSVAAYSPTADRIVMPQAVDFDSTGDYWSTLLHELTHWTGHPSRLDRRQESWAECPESYAAEELVAEMGAAFLCARLGIDLEGLQHPAYIDHWLELLRDDNRAIVRASSAARKASEYLLPADARVEAERSTEAA